MITTNEILTIISALTIIWNGWLSLKHFEIEKKYNNLCSNCIYDFTPKNATTINK